tara:strand:+ start:4409 stop:4837 length:429 start_codon:yes stop_codon:yes gene_type:complete
MKDIILVSGGFDPIHSGHIAMIEEAGKYGDVVVLLNSDKWLKNKKGKFFLPFSERSIIMQALKNVIEVISFNDEDKTCIDGIKKAIKKYPNQTIKFANGGDRNDKSTPETKFCLENKVLTIWGIGGNYKKNSSSWILEKWEK